MKIKSLLCKLAAVALLGTAASTASAMQVIVDMNTLPLSEYGTLGALHCAGCWLVFNNSPSPTQVSNTINNLGTGIIIAENIYPGLANYNTATNSGHRPTAAFSYHETGGTPGGTVLTNTEINTIKGQIGSSSVVVLARGYTDPAWSGPVNTALANSNCSGVAFEIAPYYGNGNNDDIKACIDHCISVNKQCFLLFANTASSGDNYYLQLQGEFQDLLERGAKLYDNRVILAIGNYASPSSPWLGKEGDDSVQGAEIWANNQNTFLHQYYLQNQNSSLYADVNGASKAPGAAVDQFTLKDGTNQQWFLLYDIDGYYKIENVNSHLLLDVTGASLANNALIDQFTDKDASNQSWAADANGTNFSFINENSGKALDNGSVPTVGAQLKQYTYTKGNSNQLWKLSNAD